MSTSSELLREPAVSGRTSQHTPRASSPIRFTASGSEYFRIWIVNLVLVVLTLGLYAPWARVRKLRYFYGNTLVLGSPLDFHGRPWTMLRGYLLGGLLLLAYSGAGQISVGAATVSALLLAAVWPALARASLQFRLSNTSWRGLRFRFEGSTKDSYLAWLPLALPFVLFSVMQALGPHSDHPPAPGSYEEKQFFAVMGFAFLAVSLLFPWGHWSLKRYQLGHMRFGERRSEFLARVGHFYSLAMQTGALAVGCIVLVFAAVLILVFTIKFQKDELGMLGLLPIAAIYFAALVAFNAFGTVRLQNLVWSNTRLPGAIALRSELRVRSLVWLTARNILLMALTLGLYWPFAVVARARLRLQSITVDALIDVDDFTSSAQLASHDAAGDAVGELIGIDMGL